MFLADAGDEGLTWEAKGHKQPHADAVRKAVSGFANSRGGVLLIGAEQGPGGTWSFPGIAWHADEPNTWLSSTIHAGLHPVPPFEIQVFERPDGRQAAAVEVRPVAVPPCVTSDGRVFQRVSGQTLPVTDQRVLAELFVRGEQARQTAEATARRAAERIQVETTAVLSPDDGLFSVALSPTSSPGDKAAVLFSREFADSAARLVESSLQPEPHLRYPVSRWVRQDALGVTTQSRELGKSWTLAAYWDGSVAVAFSAVSEEVHYSELQPFIERGWRALIPTLRDYGGQGECHLVIRLNPRNVELQKRRVGQTEISRWTELRDPTPDETSSVERELKRAFREFAWEPAD